VESAPASGPVPGQDQPAYQVRAQQDGFLGDEPAEGEPEQVDFGEAQGVDEGENVAGQSLDAVRDGAGRAADSAVVGEDDFAPGRDVVDEGRVPVVEVAAEVLEEYDGNRALAAETAVGVGGSVRGVDGARGGGVLGHAVHVGCPAAASRLGLCTSVALMAASFQNEDLNLSS
jgi:hypothetical protein